MKGRAISYSAEELAWLEANSTLSVRDYAAAFNAAFLRTVAGENLHALRKRRGWRTGRTGRFFLGHVAPNKGTTCAEGVGGRHPNARRHHFKPGSRSGVAARIYKPIGTERVTVEGYIERKINDDLPLQARWRAVHRIRWEEAHGPLPKDHCLKCLDGDKANTDPANWEAIPRSLLPRLNGGRGKRLVAFDEAAPELKPTILALAKLHHQAVVKAGARG